MEGSRGWEGENQDVKDTGVSLSKPVRLSILAMYSYSASSPVVVVAEVGSLHLSPLLLSRETCTCVASCLLYIWLEQLDNCELRFGL